MHGGCSPMHYSASQLAGLRGKMWQLTRPPYYCHSQMRIADCEKSSTVFVVACRDGHDCCPIELPAIPAPRSWAERLKKTEPRVRYGFLPPPRPLASGCENETCCPSQPQEDANGKLARSWSEGGSAVPPSAACLFTHCCTQRLTETPGL